MVARITKTPNAAGQGLADVLSGNTIKEQGLRTRYDYVVSEERRIEALELKRTLEAEGKPVSPELEQSIKDLTIKAQDAKAVYDAALLRAERSLLIRITKLFTGQETALIQQRSVDTVGKLRVTAEAIRNDGFRVVRGADNKLVLEDATGKGRKPGRGAEQRLVDVSTHLDTLEKNWSALNGKGTELRMAGPGILDGRMDQSGIFYDAIFDTQVDNISGVLGAAYDGAPGLGKSSFLLNAIADTKVSLTGTKVHVLATTWANVEGIMREYSPEVHYRNGTKAVYVNLSTREVTFFDAGGQVCVRCGHCKRSRSSTCIGDADIVYSATVETPYEFHASAVMIL